MQEQSANNECANSLTTEHSVCNVVSMRLGDIQKGLDQSYRDAFDRLTAIREEQTTIRSQYRRYLDLETEAKRYENRIRRIGGALRNMSAMGQHGAVLLDKGKDWGDEISVANSEESIPLWEIFATILAETGEIQVIELERMLDHLKFKTTRSAIESALKTHPNEFRVRMSGRNKFVSLKGA
ncbi:MAG: hypothetical protein ACLPN2_18385 [Terriglobales bacterium]